MRSAEASRELLAEAAGGVLTLTLNRPAALNALTPDLLKSLLQALRDAQRSAEVRAVVLTGAGRAFCSGADLAMLRAQGPESPPLGEDLRNLFNPLVLKLRSLEKPVLAAVNGTAAGAGASLALACDLRLIAEDAKIHLAFMKVGLAPDTGMSWFLTRALGPAKALEHAWTSEPLSAAQALAAGLVNRVAPAGEVLARTRELAAGLAELPARAVALTKRAVHRAASAGLEDQLEYEAHLQDVLGRTEDHREGVAAFLGKRTPKFQGR